MNFLFFSTNTYWLVHVFRCVKCVNKIISHACLDYSVTVNVSYLTRWYILFFCCQIWPYWRFQTSLNIFLRCFNIKSCAVNWVFGTSGWTWWFTTLQFSLVRKLAQLLCLNLLGVSYHWCFEQAKYWFKETFHQTSNCIIGPQLYELYLICSMSADCVSYTCRSSSTY